MYQPEPDHELPYIKQAEGDDAYEAAQEKAIDWLWDELRDADVAHTMADDVEAFLKFGELVAKFANLKKLYAMTDKHADREVRDSNKAKYAAQFINDASTIIENAYAYHVQQRTEKELDND